MIIPDLLVSLVFTHSKMYTCSKTSMLKNLCHILNLVGGILESAGAHFPYLAAATAEQELGIVGCLGNIWKIYGKCMETYGKYRGHIWENMGKENLQKGLTIS